MSFARHGNRFLFQLNEGVAELEWATPSTFRFRHTFALQLPPRSGSDAEPVTVTVNETAERDYLHHDVPEDERPQGRPAGQGAQSGGRHSVDERPHGGAKARGSDLMGARIRTRGALLRVGREDRQQSESARHAGAGCGSVSAFHGRLRRAACGAGPVRFRHRAAAARALPHRHPELGHDRLLLLLWTDAEGDLRRAPEDGGREVRSASRSAEIPVAAGAESVRHHPAAGDCHKAGAGGVAKAPGRLSRSLYPGSARSRLPHSASASGAIPARSRGGQISRGNDVGRRTVARGRDEASICRRESGRI